MTTIGFISIAALVIVQIGMMIIGFSSIGFKVRQQGEKLDKLDKRVSALEKRLKG